MEYNLPLESLRAATDTDRLLFALTERLERIAELMEREEARKQSIAERSRPRSLDRMPGQ